MRGLVPCVYQDLSGDRRRRFVLRDANRTIVVALEAWRDVPIKNPARDLTNQLLVKANGKGSHL